ncbi:MAG TPA: YicC family protein, partial [Candidatus Hydrogenedentes bacterium]|nr:YicC family protein [Candidatus Hydrogenedentota bacterium]
PPLREVVRREVARGKVNVFIRRAFGASGRARVTLDEDAARGYIEGLKRLNALAGLQSDAPLGVDRLALLDGVFIHAEAEEDQEALLAALTEGLTAALAAYNAAREAEAAQLMADMAARINAMAAAADRVEARVPEMQAAHVERLRERMREICADPALKEERVAMEAALMADRMDVTEELVRLRSHFVRARELFASAEPVGRDLNFLLQEMQREINTAGSKLRDLDSARELLWLKSELEKLREQVQNIE